MQIEPNRPPSIAPVPRAKKTQIDAGDHTRDRNGDGRQIIDEYDSSHREPSSENMDQSASDESLPTGKSDNQIDYEA